MFLLNEIYFEGFFDKKATIYSENQLLQIGWSNKKAPFWRLSCQVAVAFIFDGEREEAIVDEAVSLQEDNLIIIIEH
jgi:hypothetical protein